MKFITSLFLLFSLNALAGIEQAPPSFHSEGQKLVWIDITRANYKITYNHQKETNEVTTTFFFVTKETGFPIFDLVSNPSEVLLNDKEVAHGFTSVPDNVSTVRFAKENVKAGLNKLVIKSKVEFGVKYEKKGVSSGFFILDLTDREFLEKYVPTNYEYDQYPMDFHVKVTGTDRYHNIFANGEVEEISPYEFKISYPEYYTASSVYFHLMPLTKFKRLYFSYYSTDGRKIPVVIYSTLWSHNYLMKKKTLKVLRELENDYGPYPHPQLVIYAYKLSGGMEYPGATMTSYISLGHELHHSYFAKGVLPANGNSGWMDEAIASWRDKGYQTADKPFYDSKNLGNHSIYTRKTDSDSYEYGRSFLAYLDLKLKNLGLAGLKDFLKDYFQSRKYTTVTTQDFIGDLENYAGKSFEEDFDQYIFGKPVQKTVIPFSHKNEKIQNEHHPRFTIEDIESII